MQFPDIVAFTIHVCAVLSEDCNYNMAGLAHCNASLVPRPHPRGEEKRSGYNTTSCPTVEGHNQQTIVSDHVLTYAIYGILSMPRGPHCGAYYSNCAVIGHFTCQTAYVTGSGGMSYCNQTLLLREGRVWARGYCKAGYDAR